MSTSHHTAITTGAAANASTINAPLGQLDAAINTVDDRIDALILSDGTSDAEVVDARGGYALLDNRLDALLPLDADLSATLAAAIALPVNIGGTFTTSEAAGGVRTLFVEPASAGTHDIATLAAVYGYPNYGNSAGTLTHGLGVVGRLLKSGVAAASLISGFYSDYTITAAGAIAQACGFFMNPPAVSAGTIAQAFMMDLNEPAVSGTGVVEDNYGIRVGETTVGTQSNYGIYVEPSLGTGIYNGGSLVSTGTATIGDDTTIAGDLDVTDGNMTLIGTSTLGSELIANGGFASDAASWTPTNATLASVAGGQAGNCLEVTGDGVGTAVAVQAITTVAGRRYHFQYYYKSGTGQATVRVGSSSGGTQISYTALGTVAVWTLVTVDFDAVGATTYIGLGIGGSTAGHTDYFDTVTVKEMQGGSLAINGVITSYSGTAGITVDVVGNVGVKTTTPGVDVVGTFDYPSTVSLIEVSGNTIGRVVAKGTDSAGFDLIDAGAGENVKWMQLATDGGVTKFRSLTDAAASAADNIIVMDHATGRVGILTAAPGYPLEVTGNAYFSADVSALTFTDRTPGFEGDALMELAGVKAKDGKIDHTTLPAFARSADGEGRDLGAMISILTVAVQQLVGRMDKMEATK